MITNPALWRLITSQLRDRARRHAAGEPVEVVTAPRVIDATALWFRDRVAMSLGIGLSSDPQDIRRAANLAELLEAALIHVPESARALGLRDLLAGQDENAARCLQAAFDRGLRDPDLIAGLLAALTRTGQAMRAALVADKATQVDGLAAELADVTVAIAWLDFQAASGPPPVTADSLRTLAGARGLVGSWADYATGRMLLIEGNAQAAAETLVPLAREHPARADWTYYAATALALAGQAGEAAALCGPALDRTPGAWPLGCVLADLGSVPTAAPTSVPTSVPSEAADETAGSEAERAIRYATLAIRNSLADWTPLPPVPPECNRRAAEPEDLEAYRARLALLLACEDRPGLAHAITRPVFRRLPAADRALWEGLAAPPSGVALARARLEQADALGHPRACLLLAVLGLSSDGAAPADELLDRAATRSAELGGLLRAWADARDGRTEDAVSRLMPLAANGDRRAAYALASARLSLASRAAADGVPDQARDQVAAATAELALTARPGRADDAATALLRTAQLMSQALTTGTLPAAREGASGTVGSEPRATAGNLWERWLATITHLASGQPADVATVSFLAEALGKADYPLAAAVNVTAALATAARLRSENAIEAGTLGDLVFGLARRYGALAGSRDLFQVLLVVLDAADLGSLPGGNRLSGRLRAAVERLLEAQQETPDAPVLVGPAAAAARFLLAATGQDASAPLRWGRALLALSREHDVTAVAALPAALPAVCAAAASNRGGVPVQVTAAVQALVTAPPSDSFGSLTAARCATAIRDYDSAFRLWVRVSGEYAGSLPPELRAECARAQRHGAVLAQLAGDDLRAVSMLRLAARATDPDDPAAAGRDQRRADTLELQACAARLLALLFPGTVLPTASPGRNRLLEDVIAARPALRHALVSGDEQRARSAWAAHLREHSGDIRLPHALAVLYREHALSSPDAPAARDWLARATTLWCLLLSTDDFWDQTQATGHRAALTDRLAADLLRQHANAGARAFSAGEEPTAAAHLRLLTECSQGRVALLGRLESDLGLAWRWAEGDGAEQVSTTAARLFSDWCKDVITEAERIRDNVDGADLPPGIRLNYEGGITLLDRFVALGVQVPAAARMVLHWSTLLCRAQQDAGTESLYQKNLAIIQRAGKSADQVIAVATPGQSARGENQYLRSYFDWRAWLAEEDDERCRLVREALRWDPASVHLMDKLRTYGCVPTESET